MNTSTPSSDLNGTRSGDLWWAPSNSADSQARLAKYGVCAGPEYRKLKIEGVDLEDLASETSTPTYVYGLGFVEDRFRQLQSALGPNGILCYAVKANSSQVLLQHLAKLGAGADIVSGGELKRALAAGIDPRRIVFSGVGKRADEIDAALCCGSEGIRSINVESLDELDLIRQRVAALGKSASISLRLNPDVDPKTHPYLATGLRESKFGIAMQEGEAIAQKIATEEGSGLRLVGLACHLGSQLVDPAPFLDGLRRMSAAVNRLRATGHELDLLDLGGGFGIPYLSEEPEFDPQAWGRIIRAEAEGLAKHLVIEPGRYLVGNAGVLLTRVMAVKKGETKNYIVVDAAMNDLLRPALYQAHHEIVPLWVGDSDATVDTFDVVGPVCECGDFLAQDRRMRTPKVGDLLAVLSAGAYGMVMASTYNSRPLPAEVFVRGDQHAITRVRRTVEELIAEEQIPSWI